MRAAQQAGWEEAFVGDPEGPGRDQARDLALLIISGGAQVRALPLLG